jgi:hypothetical protein
MSFKVDTLMGNETLKKILNESNMKDFKKRWEKCVEVTFSLSGEELDG